MLERQKNLPPDRRIFCFWHDLEKVPAYLKLCSQTWSKIYPDFTIVRLDYKNLDDWLPVDEILPPNLLSILSLPMQADIIRAFLLHRWGGYWIDYDTIITKHNAFFEKKQQGIFYAFGNKNTCSIGLLYAHNNIIVEKWVNRINEKLLEDNIKIINGNELQKNWNAYGNGLLDTLLVEYKDMYVSYDRNKSNFFLEGTKYRYNDECLELPYGLERYRKYYFRNKFLPGILDINCGIIYLHNSWTPEEYKNITSTEEIIKQDMALCHLLSYTIDKNYCWRNFIPYTLLHNLSPEYSVTKEYVQIYIVGLPSTVHYEVLFENNDRYTVAIHIEDNSLCDNNLKNIFLKIQKISPEYIFTDVFGKWKGMSLYKNNIKQSDVISILTNLYNVSVYLITEIFTKSLRNHMDTNWSNFFESIKNHLPPFILPSFDISRPYYQFQIKNIAREIHFEISWTESKYKVCLHCESEELNKKHNLLQTVKNLLSLQIVDSAFTLVGQATKNIEISAAVAGEGEAAGVLLRLMEAASPAIYRAFGLTIPVSRGGKLAPLISYDTRLEAEEHTLLAELALSCSEENLPELSPEEKSLLREKHSRWWNLRAFRNIARQTHKLDFSLIFAKGGWTSETQKESVSGSGSTMAQTVVTREVITRLLAIYKYKSILDIPCGDFNWMRHVNLDGLRYLGGDIVPQLIARNRELYAGENIAFETMDIKADPLPAYDLLVVRDLFIHLTFEEIFAALSNIALSSCRHVLISNYMNFDNVELAGGYRPVNLLRPPFSLPETDCAFFEGIRAHPQRVLGLWPVENIRCYYSSIMTHERKHCGTMSYHS